MSKRSRRRSPRNFPPYQIVSIANYPVEDADSESTTDPLSADDDAEQNWLGTDSTSTSSDFDEEKTTRKPAGSWPELTDSILRGQTIITTRSVFYFIVLGWLAVASWLYIQDNQMDRLQTEDGILQFFLKFGYFSVIFLAALFLILISSVLGRKKTSQR